MARAYDTEFDSFRRRRTKRLPRWVVPTIALLILSGALVTYLMREPTIGQRDIEHKILAVVLPPPPPPPLPPPPKEQPPEPPKVMQQAVVKPTPQPPQPMPPVTDALTAREGPATGNFTLGIGNGSGRIGSGGGDAFLAYAGVVQDTIRRAIEADPQLRKSSFAIRLRVKISPEGAIQDVAFDDDGENPDRDAAIRRLLASLTISQKPPDGLPPVRLQLNSRASL